MSGSGRFCPRCGTPVGDGGLPPPDRRGDAEARLCPDCYVDAIDLVAVPDAIEVKICTQCGSVREDGEWQDLDGGDYTDVAIDAVADRIGIHREAEDVSWTVEPHQRGPNELEMVLLVTARVNGIPVEEETAVAVHIARETCSRCGRIAGDYYAGTVQVRASDRVPTDAETDRAVGLAHDVTDGTDDRNAFVSEVVERPEGVDVRVSRNNLAQRIARRIVDELGGTVGSSETLITEDEEGEEVYRVAFAVRLPKFQPGDVIALEDGRVVLVEGDIRGRALAGGEPVAIEGGAADDAERVGRLSDVTDTTLVTVEDEHAIQVLDPDTAAAETIPRPADLPLDGDTVPVLKTRHGLHAIPPSVIDEVGT